MGSEVLDGLYVYYDENVPCSGGTSGQMAQRAPE